MCLHSVIPDTCPCFSCSMGSWDLSSGPQAYVTINLFDPLSRLHGLCLVFDYQIDKNLQTIITRFRIQGVG